jgi:hypothetical protein
MQDFRRRMRIPHHAGLGRARSRLCASPGRLAGRRGRCDQADLTRPDLLPSSLSIADVGALTELRVLARESAMTGSGGSGRV